MYSSKTCLLRVWDSLLLTHVAVEDFLPLYSSHCMNIRTIDCSILLRIIWGVLSFLLYE